MATITRRQFTDAFKVEAVRLTQESGRPVAQVARELGISDNVLYRWRGEQQQAENQRHSRQWSAIQGAGLALRQLPLLRPARASGGFITPWKIRTRAPAGTKGSRQ